MGRHISGQHGTESGGPLHLELVCTEAEIFFLSLCLPFSFCFVFLLFSFLSFIFFSFLCFFSPIDLRLSCVCVVIDTEYIRGSLSWAAIGIVGFSRRE